MKFSYAKMLLLGFMLNMALILSDRVILIHVNQHYEETVDRFNRNQVLGAMQLASAMDALWKLRYGFPQFMVLGLEDRERILAEEPKLYAQIEDNLNEVGRQP